MASRWGSDINLWKDSWCGAPLVSAMNIHHLIHHRLQATVNLFIIDSSLSLKYFPIFSKLLIKSQSLWLEKMTNLSWIVLKMVIYHSKMPISFISMLVRMFHGKILSSIPPSPPPPKSKSVVPWQLRNIWENCSHLTSSISFFITHIYREGNHCVDKLASISLALNTFFWWDHLPSQLEMDFARNRLCLPYFRFVNLFWGLGCMSPLSFVSCSLFL